MLTESRAIEPTFSLLPEGKLLFAGDTSRISLGYVSGGQFQGELSAVLLENPQEALVGEGWFSRSAGGVKLSFHRLSDGTVSKYFVAIDQNQMRDRKLTLGYGLERENWFGNINFSRGLTDRRLLDQETQAGTFQESGSLNDQPYVDTITRTKTTRIYEKAYDQGLGVRAGHYFAEWDARVTGGLDYEWGGSHAKQTTISLAAEKIFIGTPHSVGAQLDHSQKSGDAENTRHSTRLTVQYRYALGGTASFQPQRQYRLTPSKRVEFSSSIETLPPTVIPARLEKRWVKNKATMTGDAFFEFDSAQLTSVARTQLDRVAQRLNAGGRDGKIRIVGHTCDIGSDKVNDRLSLKRALAVKDYLVSAAGLTDEDVHAEGRGKREPAYPVSPQTREKNRRVEIEFFRMIDLEEVFEIPEQVIPGKPAETKAAEIAFEREYVDQPAVWSRRALRTAALHKRTVDVYRSKEETTVETRSREFVNRAPSARDDSFSVIGGAPTPLSVLSNDTDPDTGDSLTIVSVTSPAIGQIRLDGRQLIYTGPVNFNGQDRFSYTVKDTHGLTSNANVTVTISAPNRSPLAQDDSFIIASSSPISLPILSNDSDPDGDVLSIISVTPPTGNVGRVEIAGNQIVFAMAQRFLMSTFTYTVSDGKGGQATAVVTLMDP